jgi:transcription elongation factor Elf1
MSEQVENVVAYMKFEFDCPFCDGVTSLDHDPAGEDVECSDCGETVHISESR